MIVTRVFCSGAFPQLPSLRLAVVRLPASAFAAVAAAVGCVPRGQRALLDADMLELIDRSACLVELVTVESCAPPVLVLSPQQARPAPRPVAAREFSLREALWKVFCSLGCSFRDAPVASLRLLLLTGKSWMIWSLLFCHVVDVMFFLTDLLCVVFLLHNCESFDRRDPLVRFPYLPFLHGLSELSSNEDASPSSAVTSGCFPHSSMIASCLPSLFACFLPLSSC